MTERIIRDAATLRGWRKSSFSGNNGGNCVEVVAGYAAGVPVRDSKAPHGPALVFGGGAWSSFIASVKAGTLDV